ncbi:hypothetical protein BGZ99_009395, partial [Dissophora globulifera]
MFAKSKNFVAPLVVALVACMTVEAVSLPQWCTCGDVATTKSNCISWGSFDGHTCKVTTDHNYDQFGVYCKLGDGNDWPVCWGQ